MHHDQVSAQGFLKTPHTMDDGTTKAHDDDNDAIGAGQAQENRPMLRGGSGPNAIPAGRIRSKTAAGPE